MILLAKYYLPFTRRLSVGLALEPGALAPGDDCTNVLRFDLASYLWLFLCIPAIPNIVKGSEFVQKIQRLGRERNISVQLVTERGKGSHATLYFGTRFTIVKDRKKEIGPGLLQKMLSDLGLDKTDIR